MRFFTCFLFAVLLASCHTEQELYSAGVYCGGVLHVDPPKLKVNSVVLEKLAFTLYDGEKVEIQFSAPQQGLGKIYAPDSSLVAEFDTKTGDCAQSFYREFYPNGKLKMEATAGSDSTRFNYFYISNCRSGKFTGYDSLGNIAYTEYWMDGKPYGPYKAWHSNGKPRLEGQFDSRGKMSGVWKFYNSKGELVKTRRYPVKQDWEWEEIFALVSEEASLGGSTFSESSYLLQVEITELSDGQLQDFDHKHKALYLVINEDGLTSLWGKNENGFYTIYKDMGIKAWPARIGGRKALSFYKINYSIEGSRY